MIIVFSIYGSRTHSLSGLPAMLTVLFSDQFVMTNPGTIMFCFPQRVITILVLNGVAGLLLVTLSHFVRNPWHIFTILLGFLCLYLIMESS